MAESHPTSKPVEYREIQGVIGYRVGDDGTVWSKRLCAGPSWPRLSDTWRPLSLDALINGYPVVGLMINGKQKIRYVHHLVLEAFVGPRPKGMQACHFPDRDPRNSKLLNLRWDTPSGNCRDKEFQGTHQIGEKNPRAKLTAESVISIRERVYNGELPRCLAAEFRVTSTLIRLIVKRQCWKHI